MIKKAPPPDSGRPHSRAAALSASPSPSRLRHGSLPVPVGDGTSSIMGISSLEYGPPSPLHGWLRTPPGTPSRLPGRSYGVSESIIPGSAESREPPITLRAARKKVSMRSLQAVQEQPPAGHHASAAGFNSRKICCMKIIHPGSPHPFSGYKPRIPSAEASQIPRSVIKPVTSLAGVTSKA